MKSLLPMILVVLLLTGAITYSLSKRIVPKQEETRFGIAANKLKGSADTITPTPTKATLTPSITPKTTPSPSPSLVIAKPTDLPTTKGGLVATKTVTTTTKTVVCTPVYGQANTCTEHIVVDTGAADAIFFNFAGISYLAGLASFVFAKRA